jgi:predicted esterase
MLPLSFTTPRTARYLSLGEPGPAIAHMWVCLHGHGQPMAELAAQLQNLDTPERLLLLPEALSRYEQPQNLNADGIIDEAPRTDAAWFAAETLLPDLTDLSVYLDALVNKVLAECPPNTPVTVLGYGHGAAAACRWLAGNSVAYDRLILVAPVFPAAIDRRATLVALPEKPVLVVSTTTDTYSPEAAGEGLMQDLLQVGLSAQQRLVDATGPLPLAALAGAAG